MSTRRLRRSVSPQVAPRASPGATLRLRRCVAHWISLFSIPGTTLRLRRCVSHWILLFSIPGATLRLRRSVSHGISLLAILLVTFAPSLTGALAASRGLGWDQVCSATEPAAAKPASTRDGSPAAPHVFEHCPYCALHADLAPPPDPRQADAGAPLAFRERPAAFVHAPRANAVWASAQPRAPPVLA